jgi:hypothetical protein
MVASAEEEIGSEVLPVLETNRDEVEERGRKTNGSGDMIGPSSPKPRY